MGLKPTKEEALPLNSFKPSAEADGKREVDGALGIADADRFSVAPCQAWGQACSRT